jgi:hypothetical protein
VSADSLLLVNAAQLAFRNKPALATNGAQDATFGDFLAKSLEELLLGLVRAQRNCSQISHLLSSQAIQHIPKKSPADERGSAEPTTENLIQPSDKLISSSLPLYSQ